MNEDNTMEQHEKDAITDAAYERFNDLHIDDLLLAIKEGVYEAFMKMSLLRHDHYERKIYECIKEGIREAVLNIDFETFSPEEIDD